MRALIQRVKSASVVIAGTTVGEIDQGILCFLAVQREDREEEAEKLLRRLLAYRIFSDDKQQMNLSLQDIDGGLLVISQFTLAANTKKGLRPSFSSAAQPERAETLYDHFVQLARELHPKAAAGRFGADMQVHLINDGPVTFLLEV